MGTTIVESKDAVVGVDDENPAMRPMRDSRPSAFSWSKLPARTKFVVGCSMGDPIGTGGWAALAPLRSLRIWIGHDHCNELVEDRLPERVEFLATMTKAPGPPTTLFR